MNELVEYRAVNARNVRGTKVEKGQILFAIRDTLSGLFFIWSYTDRAFAQVMLDRVRPQSNADIQANWRDDVAKLTPSNRTRD